MKKWDFNYKTNYNKPPFWIIILLIVLLSLAAILLVKMLGVK